MKRVVIIGGGISGLAAAHQVLERCKDPAQKIQVSLLEAGPRTGGIIQTEERDGYIIERGPDSFITEKPEALALARRLDLQSHLIETNKEHRRSFVVRKGRLLPIPSGFNLLAPARLWPFVTSPIFSWPGKARMAMDLLLPRRSSDIAADESLAHFVRRRLGREALERMAQPMAGGIYTADPEMLSLGATMPRFQEMERKHRSLILALRNHGRPDGKRRDGNGVSEGFDTDAARSVSTSGARYGLFMSFDRGMELFAESLAAQVLELDAECWSRRPHEAPIRFETPVQTLALKRNSEPGDGRSEWLIRTSRGETLLADAICLALPSYVSGQLLRRIDPELSSELAGISYASSATINLAYRRDDIAHPLNGFGFVVPFIEKRTVMACSFSSIKFPNRAPAGSVLLRAFAGGALQPELVDLTTEELITRAHEDLRTLLGIREQPLFAEVTKWERSMPQYFVGHLDRIERIESRAAMLPGLALAGNAYAGPGIPDCIRSGQSAADRLVDGLLNQT
jgi:oxygen-dependent protoporphyrinogen oxidase